MLRNPYAKFRERELTLNDYLAIDRTDLANERTLLSYGRTAIALVITGGSAIKFFDSLWLEAAGFILIALAAVVILIGWRRYRRMKKRLAAALHRETGESTHPLTGDCENSNPETPPPPDASGPRANT